MFEQFARWTAINIGTFQYFYQSVHLILHICALEANPPSFNLLKQNRPDSINIFAALCSEEKLLHYIDLGPLATRGFLELMNPEFIRKYHPQYISDKNIIEDYASMKCSKFSHIWRLLELKSVDLWILDVEGAELSVLQVRRYIYHLCIALHYGKLVFESICVVLTCTDSYRVLTLVRSISA